MNHDHDHFNALTTEHYLHYEWYYSTPKHQNPINDNLVRINSYNNNLAFTVTFCKSISMAYLWIVLNFVELFHSQSHT